MNFFEKIRYQMDLIEYQRNRPPTMATPESSFADQTKALKRIIGNELAFAVGTPAHKLECSRIKASMSFLPKDRISDRAAFRIALRDKLKDLCLTEKDLRWAESYAIEMPDIVLMGITYFSWSRGIRVNGAITNDSRFSQCPEKFEIFNDDHEIYECSPEIHAHAMASACWHIKKTFPSEACAILKEACELTPQDPALFYLYAETQFDVFKSDSLGICSSYLLDARKSIEKCIELCDLSDNNKLALEAENLLELIEEKLVQQAIDNAD